MTSYISETVKIGGDTLLGRNCVIMDNVVIGANCEIGHNVVIHDGTILGDRVLVGDNVVLGQQPRSGKTSIRKTESQGPLVVDEEALIGTATVIYAGTHLKKCCMVADMAAVREGCEIGEGARVGRCVTVECNTKVGKNSVIQTATYLTGDMIIEDDVFIGPCVSTANDKYMSRDLSYDLQGPIIKTGASVGANATLLPAVVVGERAVVGAGAVVVRDVPPDVRVMGNPADVL